MKSLKNKTKLARLLRQVRDKQLQTAYLRYLHDETKKFSFWSQFQKIEQEKKLPLSLRFYKDARNAKAHKYLSVDEVQTVIAERIGGGRREDSKDRHRNLS